MTQRYVSDIEQFTSILRKEMKLMTPLDPVELTKKLGGSIVEDIIEEDREAKIEKLSEREFRIFVKKGTHNNRKKFSIAHELGHLFLHMGFLTDHKAWGNANEYDDSIRYRYGYSNEEKEANAFAGALLMPKNEFIFVANKHLESEFYKLKPIADHFQVSIDAVRLRGRYLKLFSWE